MRHLPVVPWVVAALTFVVVSPVSAQGLPPASRTVFKCEVTGKTVYSDSPCLGAKKIEVEPTRGLNKSTGRERVGRDVQNERLDESFAEAVRPITGKDAKQRAVATRRFKLSAEAQRECRRLDEDIPRQEKAERESDAASLPLIQRQLLTMRTRMRELNC